MEPAAEPAAVAIATAGTSLSSSSHGATPAADTAEYERFLAEQQARVEAEEAAIVESARRELAERPNTTLYVRALDWLTRVLNSAQELNSRMAALMAKYMERLDSYTRTQPAALSGGTLRDYQFAGFRWLVERFLMNESVIVADEMGLGKTIQVISLLAWMHDNAVDSPVLIVAPLSTVGNWMDEIQRFTPAIPVVKYRGSAVERELLRTTHIPAGAYSHSDLRREENARARAAASSSSAPIKSRSGSSGRKRSSPAAAASAASSTSPASDAAVRPGFSMPVFVTNLETVLRDAELLSRVHWRLVVVDEGHKLKKEEGAIRRALSTFKSRDDGGGLMKVLLTGTPVQNDIMELWSLCNFVMPGIFKDKKEFGIVYQFIALGTEVGAAFVQQQERQNHIVSKLHELLSRYMLRRTKTEVHLSLPPKVEVLVYTPLTVEQVRMLKALEEGTLAGEIKKMQWRPARARETFDAAGDDIVAISTNNIQMQMRKICAHPFFIAEPPLPPATFTTEAIISCCGKMVVLDRMLRHLRAHGHKVLIFSQFVTVLEILSDYFTFVGTSALGEYRVLHGGVPADDRDTAIREFNNDPDNRIFAFLLATRAGGLGINLAAADTVIFFDSDWNPKSDAQAMDRAHRIGQTRPVVVYRLVTEGASVERRMVKAADAKGALAKLVLQEGRARLEAAMHAEMSSKDASSAGGEEDLPADVAAELRGTAEVRVGLARESLLRYWLRAGLTDHIIRGGIKDDELLCILDRARALQAGQRVAVSVERAVVSDVSAASPDVEVVSTPVPPAAAGKRARSGMKDASPIASTPSSSNMKRARAAVASGGSDSVLHHHAVPASAHASASTLDAAEREMNEWEAMAAAAPYTPSKGSAYEFVYHEASRGLLSISMSRPPVGAGNA